jgi:ectoine hydroxylase-related dioxygenase (phytanoyl-CoA dioxygenase family)
MKNELGLLMARELDFFDQNGYLIVKHLYTKDDVEKMGELANKLKEIALGMANNLPENNLAIIRAKELHKSFYNCYKGAKFMFKYPPNKAVPSITKIIWAGAIEPDLLHYSQDNKLTILVSQILKNPYANHLANQVHCKIPHDGVSFPIHQDLKGIKSINSNIWPNVDARGGTLTCITAIDAMTNDNGPIIVVPKSHKYGLLDLSSQDEENNNEAKLIKHGFDPTKDLLTITMDPGDVLLMHGHLLHYSNLNKSFNERKILLNEFSFPGLMQHLVPGQGSGKLIKLDPTFEFSDLLFSLNVLIKGARCVLHLDDFMQNPTFDYALILSINLNQITGMYFGANAYTLSWSMVNALAGMYYYRTDYQEDHLWDGVVSLSSMALFPALNGYLAGSSAYYLNKYLGLDNFPYAPYVGSAYGLVMLACNTYDLGVKLLGKEVDADL